MSRFSTVALAFAAATMLSACAEKPVAVAPAATESTAPDDGLNSALATIDTAGLLRHIKVLSSDEFEGRLPGTPGEEKSVAYIIQQFKALGLAPGNPDGSYVQKVPLVGIEGTPTMKLTARGHKIAMQYRDDFVAATTHVAPQVKVANSDLVFVGYGVQAPEYGWDDYKGMDVKGKTIVMLINDPAIPDPKDPSKLDDAMFKGRAMTYYGRWTYKYEIASKLGAAAAIIVHETEPAAYPWEVVRNSWAGEQFSLATPDKNMSRVPVQGWITLDKARELFKAGGQDYDALKAAALSRDFRPVPLKAKASFVIDNRIREVQSQNVVARLEGSDEKLRNEVEIYSAHWDHFGKKESPEGTQIFHGAADNASGVAGLLEIAQAFEALKVKPKRSIVFLAVTAEEQGLLGSAYYAANPLYPLAKTVATFNMDVLGTWGATRDVQIIGAGQNTIEDEFTQIAVAHGRTVVPDAEPQKGSYFRSDQFSFAKVGVPSLYLKAGIDVPGKPGYGQGKRDEYTARDYHKPTDVIKPDWDLGAAVTDTRLLVEIGLRVSDDTTWPTWKAGSEFKAARDAAPGGTY